VDARRELGATRVSPRVFRRQMEALARAGVRTVGSAELERLVGAIGAVPPAAESHGLARSAPHRSLLTSHPSLLMEHSSLVLTFDDGYDALSRDAFPVLADLGMCALVFAVTDYVGRDNDWDVHYGWRRFRHLSWDELARWQERGIEVHSHGATHARLTWLTDAQVEDELGRSRAALAQRFGTAPAGICYPFGAVDARVRALAAKAGYTLGFAGPAGPEGRRHGGADSLALRRRPVYAWDPFAPPRVLREGAAGAIWLAAARAANRIAVATSLIQRLSGAGASGRG
jgi:peptidoglycan/xylan/chitin deacetylase (PgdA/CDA1 family)